MLGAPAKQVPAGVISPRGRRGGGSRWGWGWGWGWDAAGVRERESTARAVDSKFLRWSRVKKTVVELTTSGLSVMQLTSSEEHKEQQAPWLQPAAPTQGSRLPQAVLHKADVSLWQTTLLPLQSLGLLDEGQPMEAMAADSSD